MKLQVLNDANSVAVEAARIIAAAARAAVTARSRFVFAVSGGQTPWKMLRALCSEDVPWKNIHVFQVDERIAPPGDPDRNLTRLHESLLDNAPLSHSQIHAMPVEEPAIDLAPEHYTRLLEEICGKPAVLDLVHLGLGSDGHTASLVPNDPVLEVLDRDVALTNIYLKRRRMTLTFPILNRSRQILWVVTGPEKVGMLPRLLAADVLIPAGRVQQEQALVLADSSAAVQMPQ